MNSRSYCNPLRPPRATDRRLVRLLAGLCWALACVLPAAADAPQWLRTASGATLPAYDEKTDAVLLYSDINVTVISTDKVKTQVRRAYKILRPGGREYGVAVVDVNPRRKVTSLHGWCIPAQGKGYEVK